MLELLTAGGWLMVPILLCSVVAVGICIERLVALNRKKIAPPHLLATVWQQLKNESMSDESLKKLRVSSPLGNILAAGLSNARQGRDVMKESIQEAASHVVHEMERHLDTLGTIAAITPLLGLLGTVMGMIKVFAGIMAEGTGNASVLAGGISEALITTATGLVIAIPALAMHRYFERRIDTIVVELEQESIKLVDALHGEKNTKKTVKKEARS